MSSKKKLLFLTILSFSVSNLEASKSDLEEKIIEIKKIKETYWDVAVPKQLLLRSFHEVDVEAIKGASELLALGLSDQDRRIQQAILQHEDAKFAFNLACQEYSILLEEGKIKPSKEKVSPKTLAYLNLVKNQEVIKNDYFSLLSYRSPQGLEPAYFYLEPYIYNPIKDVFNNLNDPISSSDQERISNSVFQSLEKSFDYSLGEPKIHFCDDFKGDNELKAAYGIYTKKVNGGAGLNDMDVHAYNAKFNFKEFLPTILLKDNKSRRTDPASTVIAEMKKTFVYKVYPKQVTLNTSLSRLSGHLKKQKVEAKETGVNVEEILSRIWSLIVNNPDEIDNLFRVFCDNEETRGGCFPGHAGRLADFYVKALRKEHFTKQVVYY